jgi:hypothetical protein
MGGGVALLQLTFSARRRYRAGQAHSDFAEQRILQVPLKSAPLAAFDRFQGDEYPPRKPTKVLRLKVT